MADDLQRKYREYANRKRNAFRGAVKKAYSIVLHSYGVSDQNGSSTEETSEESAGDEERFVSIIISCVGILFFGSFSVAGKFLTKSVT